MKKTLLLCFLCIVSLVFQAQNPICFTPAANYAVGMSPNTVAAANLNNDGYDDMIVANYNSTKISVLMGNSTGAFAAAIEYPASYGILSIAPADFNNDGKIDLAMVGLNNSNVTVLIGNGDGSFAAPVYYPVSNNLHSVAASDLNGDGNMDLAIAAYSSNNVSILTGNGTGAFVMAGTYPVHINPNFVGISDFNNDGLKDLVVTYSSTDEITILTGGPNATFTTTQEYTVGAGHTAIAMEDFNHDGNIDLGAPNIHSSSLSIMAGNGNGTFGTAITYPAGTNPYNVASADFNGDGHMDLVMPHINSAIVSVLAGNGTGSFATAINYPTGSGARGIACGDFNGDGKSDIVCSNTFVNTLSFIKNGLTVSMNTGFVCQGSGSSYTLDPTGADTYTYSSGSNVVTPAATTDYTITGSTFNGCVNTAVATVSLINCVQASGLDFDGVNDIISVPASASLNNLGQNGITMETWIYPRYVTGFQSIIRKTGDYVLFLYDGKLIAQVWYMGTGAPNYKEFSWPVALTANQWSHIAFTWNGSQGRIYINGVDGGANYYSNVNSGSETLHLGGSSINGQYFDGRLDELRIWNVARTPCEIYNHMNCEVPGTASDLVASYHFNQGNVAVGNQTVTALADASGNSNTGTLNNFTLNGFTSNWTASSGVVSNYTTAATVPIVGIDASALSVCEQETVSLNGTGADYYSWSNGIYDGNNFYPSVTNTYTVTGYFQSTGCTNTAVITITVNALPEITVSGGTICEGESFTITPSGASTYTVAGGSFVVSPTYNNSYYLTGTSAEGCEGNGVYVNINVDSKPYITVNSGLICAGETFTIEPYGALTYTISGGSAVVSPVAETVYTVSGTGANGCVGAETSTVAVNDLPVVTVNSGAICNGDYFAIVPAGADYYNYSGGNSYVGPATSTDYTVTGYYNNGCHNEAVSSVTVNELPVITVNSGTICMGQSFTLTPAGALTYTYSSVTEVVSPTSDETYYVSGTDGNGCVSATDAIAMVTVNALPVVTVNSGTVCAGQGFTMTPGGALTYTFSGGSNVYVPAVGASYSVTSQGVSGSDANGCVGYASSYITAYEPPVISATTNNTLLCTGQTATLSVTGNATTYTWSTTETAMDIAVSPTATTTYTVEGTDVNGCFNSTSITQDVSLCTGVASVSANDASISVYPNPNHGLFIVQVSSVSKVTVTNALGEVVLSETMEAGKHNLSIQELAAGIYFVNTIQNNKQYVVKIIKE